jgi:hypothetical protein
VVTDRVAERDDRGREDEVIEQLEPADLPFAAFLAFTGRGSELEVGFLLASMTFGFHRHAEESFSQNGNSWVGARLSEEDIEAQIAAALAAAAIGRDGVAYEMLERARLWATADDHAFVATVEERIDAGPEESGEFLREDFGPDLLRGRLKERP